MPRTKRGATDAADSASDITEATAVPTDETVEAAAAPAKRRAPRKKAAAAEEARVAASGDDSTEDVSQPVANVVAEAIAEAPADAQADEAPVETPAKKRKSRAKVVAVEAASADEAPEPEATTEPAAIEPPAVEPPVVDTSAAEAPATEAPAVEAPSFVASERVGATEGSSPVKAARKPRSARPSAVEPVVTLGAESDDDEPTGPPSGYDEEEGIISSLENEKVKWVRSLHEKRARDRENAFLIEGVRLVEEALGAGVDVVLALFDPSVVRQNSRARQIIDALGKEAIPVTDRVLRSVADTVTPQGVVAVVRVPEPSEPYPGGNLLLVIDAIQDPGNLGAILRTANAAGVQAVVLSSDCTDVYSPKVVRAGMGAHFHLDIFAEKEWGAIDRLLARRQVLVGSPSGGRPYFQVDWGRPTALVVSNEASGPSHGALRLANVQGNSKVSIPMTGPADSLNAAVAAGIMIFEAYRQTSASRVRTERPPARPTDNRNTRYGPSDRGGYERDRGGYDSGPRDRGNDRQPPYDRGPYGGGGQDDRPPRGPRPPFRGGPPPRSGGPGGPGGGRPGPDSPRGGGGGGGWSGPPRSGPPSRSGPPGRGGPPSRGGGPSSGGGGRPFSGPPSRGRR